MPIPVANEQVAALLGWQLKQPPQQGVFELFHIIAKLHTNSAPRRHFQSPTAATAIVPLASDVLA
jgi:hypothetical protein